MEFNLLNIKLERAVTVSFYILSVLLPVTFGWLIYDSKSFFSIDLIKLLIASISISGCSIIFNFIINAFFFGFMLALVTTYNKYKSTSDQPKSQEIGKSTDLGFSEYSLNIAFFLNDLTAMIIICNLLKLKYFDNADSNSFLTATLNTYFLVLGIWYTFISLIFIIMAIAWVMILRNKWKENYLAFLLFRAIVKQREEKSDNP